MDYGVFFRRPINPKRIDRELPRFDVFVSAFNSSDRVTGVFDRVRADTKIWIVHPEYGYSEAEIPTTGKIVKASDRDEVVQINDLLRTLGDLQDRSICVDITGFMRHVLSFLVVKVARMGVTNITAVYSEPDAYTKQEKTTFSTETTGTVRPIRGMAGTVHSQGRDHLILGIGYDHKLIGEVTSHKDGSVYPVFAFPSLSPDMYQQSAVRSSASGEITLGTDWNVNRWFAPANDPFATAGVLRDIVAQIDRREQDANVYLAALSTKVQCLGFALYWELQGRRRNAVTMLTPECVSYATETSRGLKRLWAYSVDLRL